MKYYREHRESYIEYMRKYNKAYYEANRGRIAAKQQATREERARLHAETKTKRSYVRKVKEKVKEEVCNIVYMESPRIRSALFIDKGNFTLEFR